MSWCVCSLPPSYNASHLLAQEHQQRHDEVMAMVNEQGPQPKRRPTPRTSQASPWHASIDSPSTALPPLPSPLAPATSTAAPTHAQTNKPTTASSALVASLSGGTLLSDILALGVNMPSPLPTLPALTPLSATTSIARPQLQPAQASGSSTQTDRLAAFVKSRLTAAISSTQSDPPPRLAPPPHASLHQWVPSPLVEQRHALVEAASVYHKPTEAEKRDAMPSK